MSEIDVLAKTVECPVCGVPEGVVCIASNMRGQGGAPATAHAHEKRVELAKRSERPEGAQ